MSWGKICDTLHAHPKVLDADLEAMGLWVVGLSHCAAYLTDGHLKRLAAMRLAGTAERLERLASRLVAAVLWEQHPTGDGWQYHDYFDFNPPRAEVLGQRSGLSEKRAEAGRKGAAKRWGGSKPMANGWQAPDGKGGNCHGADHGPVPSPSRPVPDPKPVDEEQRPLSLQPNTTKSKKGATKRSDAPAPDGYVDVIATFSAEYERARNEKPVIDAKTGKAAKSLLAQIPDVAAACALIRTAFAKPFVANDKPSLLYIAANVNDFRGTTKPRGNGLAQAVPSDGPAWDLPAEGT